MSRVYTQEMVDELMKCKDDPIYFGENYYTQIHLTNGRNAFPLFDKQKEAIRSIQDNPVTVGLVARQTGMTTTAGIYALWEAIFHADRTIGLVTPKYACGENALKRIKDAYEDMPNWLKPSVKSWNKREVVFSNDSRIVTASSSSAFCGFTCNTLLLSDAAFYREKEFEELYYSLMPIVTSAKNSRVFIWSSANGNGLFKTLYKKANSNSSRFAGWSNLKVSWEDVPGRGSRWKEKMIECMGEEAFKSEMECKFKR